MLPDKVVYDAIISFIAQLSYRCITLIFLYTNPGFQSAFLFNRHALGQISGLINVGAAQDRHVIGEHLQRHY